MREKTLMPHDHQHDQHTSPDVAAPGKVPERAGAMAHGDHTGAHDRHEGHSVAMFRDRFWITLLLSIPTLLWSGMVQQMLGFAAPIFPGSLVRSDPRDVPRIIALSKASYRKMIQNLWWAAGYNIVAIPLAAGVLANEGILLPPALAAVLMSASTVIVALNAQLLRRARL